MRALLPWALIAGLTLGGGYHINTPASAADTAPAVGGNPSEEKRLWTFVMPNLQSGRKSIRDLAGTNQSDYILVNFWASWCIPCRREMPMLQTLSESRADEGFLVVGVAIDDEEKARPVVETLRIGYPILLADFDGTELMGDVGNEQGLLPYTVLLDSRGKVLESKLGEIHQAELDTWFDR